VTTRLAGRHALVLLRKGPNGTAGREFAAPRWSWVYRVETLRNLTRRKLRNALTVGGIVIGVLALTTMGGLAESINSLVDGGVRFYSDHVSVVSPGGLIRTDKLAEIERVTGVDAALPFIDVPARSDSSGFNLVNPAVVAFGEGYEDHERFKLSYNAGGRPRAPGEVALGVDLASQLKARVGDTVTLPIPPKHPANNYVPHTFRVVGVMNRTLTAPDSWAVVVFADGQTLLRDQIPPALRPSANPSELATAIDVFGKPGVDLDQLARRINLAVADVRAQPPSEVISGFQSTATFFTLITTAAALIAMVIGGLSVVNTMVMAVSERAREIGLKKALGAHTRHILVDYLLEATLIGALGGGIGVLLGLLATFALNSVIGGQTTSLFLVTPRLAALALGFAVVLGCGAGIIPALRAARLDPVEALRSQ
jgi:putative ABC transport system permease protein